MTQNMLYGIVLLSAIGHASWNALLKKIPDRLVMMVAIRIVGLFYGFILLFFAGMPSIGSLKWVAAAAAAMWVYQGLLVQSYNFGDLSFVYPLARGVASVILTASASFCSRNRFHYRNCWGALDLAWDHYAWSFGSRQPHRAEICIFGRFERRRL
jgi:hypothetical protein